MASKISDVWDFQIHFQNSGNSQFQNEASGKTKMDAIAIFHSLYMPLLSLKLLICGDTTSYELYKWIKAVTKLRYRQIHDTM